MSECLSQAFWKGDAPATDEPTKLASLDTREWFQRSDSASFAIISLRLSSVTDNSFPPRAVAHHVKTFYDDQQTGRSLEIFDYPFAFPTQASTAEFKRSMLALSRHLKE